jgi:mRNA interferase RelE/StbE
MHKLVIERYALKNIAKINASHLPAIKDAIASLALHPRPHGYKKLKGKDAYRIRSGDYRIIYEIHDNIIPLLLLMLVIERKFTEGYEIIFKIWKGCFQKMRMPYYLKKF